MAQMQRFFSVSDAEIAYLSFDPTRIQTSPATDTAPTCDVRKQSIPPLR